MPRRITLLCLSGGLGVLLLVAMAARAADPRLRPELSPWENANASQRTGRPASARNISGTERISSGSVIQNTITPMSQLSAT